MLWVEEKGEGKSVLGGEDRLHLITDVERDDFAGVEVQENGQYDQAIFTTGGGSLIELVPDLDQFGKIGGIVVAHNGRSVLRVLIDQRPQFPVERYSFVFQFGFIRPDGLIRHDAEQGICLSVPIDGWLVEISMQGNMPSSSETSLLERPASGHPNGASDLKAELQLRDSLS